MALTDRVLLHPCSWAQSSFHEKCFGVGSCGHAYLSTVHGAVARRNPVAERSLNRTEFGCMSDLSQLGKQDGL